MTLQTSVVARRNSTPRRLVLEPYVVKLGLYCVEHLAGDAGGSVCLSFGERVLQLTPFELSLLTGTGSEEDLDRDTSSLAVECLALLTKTLEDLELLREASATEHGPVSAVQAELMLDGALGPLLLGELQRRIDDVVGCGRIDAARELTRIQHRLRRGLAEVGRTMDGSERNRTQALATSLGAEPVAQPEPAAARPRAAAAPGERRVRRRRRRLSVTAALPQGASATALLGIALLVLGGLWAALFGAPRLFHQRVQAPDLRSFTAGPVLTRVDAPYPSLYLRVDDEVWAGLDESARRALLADVARVAGRYGYLGALVETDGGRPVAQWLARSGTRSLEAPEGRDMDAAP